MDKKQPKGHGFSRSEPAGGYESLVEMSSFGGHKPGLLDPDLEAGKLDEEESLIEVVPVVDSTTGRSGKVIPLNKNPELAIKIEKITRKLQKLQDQLSGTSDSAAFVPMTLTEKVKYYCYRTKQWVCEHKGKVTLVIIGGAVCIYFGYYLGAKIHDMSDACDSAIDGAKDCVNLVGQALPFCKHTLAQCKESGVQCDRANVMFATLLTMLKNGTCALAKEFTQEAIVTFGEMLDVCRRATDFGYHPQ